MYRPTGIYAIFGGGWEGEWFMVKDQVWKAATGDVTRFLCVGCLEQRLGRKLKANDFSRSAKVNLARNIRRAFVTAYAVWYQRDG
jgi:hypothetical protein